MTLSLRICSFLCILHEPSFLLSGWNQNGVVKEEAGQWVQNILPLKEALCVQEVVYQHCQWMTVDHLWIISYKQTFVICPVCLALLIFF